MRGGLTDGGVRRGLGSAAAAVAVGAGLAVLGPFGTGADFSPEERYAYWVGLTVLMWLQTEAAAAALRRVPGWTGRPEWLQATAAGLAGAVPTTFEVAWAEGLLRVGGVLTPRSLVETYASVALIAVGFYVPLALARRDRRPRPAPVTAASFRGALPPGLGGSILALTAEDHYLRVHTERGQALIHHRFSDAVRELGEAGVQTHRSWWVAKGAVERAERQGDRHVLVLAGGLRAPVSRTFSLAVRQAGLIADPD